MSTTPIRVAVTGAAGQIGYSLLFRIACGALFGPKQPIILHLVEIEPALPALHGVVMELDDCAFPLLAGMVPTANLEEGFRGVNWALLVGSVPRKQGMKSEEHTSELQSQSNLVCRLLLEKKKKKKKQRISQHNDQTHSYSISNDCPSLHR